MKETEVKPESKPLVTVRFASGLAVHYGADHFYKCELGHWNITNDSQSVATVTAGGVLIEARKPEEVTIAVLPQMFSPPVYAPIADEDIGKTVPVENDNPSWRDFVFGVGAGTLIFSIIYLIWKLLP